MKLAHAACIVLAACGASKPPVADWRGACPEVHGRVVDADTAAPVVGARIVVEGGVAGPRRTFTDAAGDFQIAIRDHIHLTVYHRSAAHEVDVTACDLGVIRVLPLPGFDPY